MEETEEVTHSIASSGGIKSKATGAQKGGYMRFQRKQKNKQNFFLVPNCKMIVKMLYSL